MLLYKWDQHDNIQHVYSTDAFLYLSNRSLLLCI